MSSSLSFPLKLALWTSSLGIAAWFAHRLFVRPPAAIDAGSVSQEWIAQHRWPLEHES